MTLAEFGFWLSVGLVVYTYLGYPLILIVIGSAYQVALDLRYVSGKKERRVMLNRRERRSLLSNRGRPNAAPSRPAVCVLIAAYNEEKHIAQRIQNILAQDYPEDRLRIYIGSDASSDRTDEIVQSLSESRVRLFAFDRRRGKAAVLNDLVRQAEETILVFSDANTEFESDAIENLVRHFTDAKVGLVCGELYLTKAATQTNQDASYWRYEQLLKFYESRINGLSGANGAIYAMRKELFEALPSGTIVDDFVIAMSVKEQGYRVIYDPEAIAHEESARELRNEFARRVRIGIGNYQALWRFRAQLSPLRGIQSFTFFSHKVIRWFVPHLALSAFAFNAFLLGSPFYFSLFAAQTAGYAYAGIGYLVLKHRNLPALLKAPVFIAAMNAAFLVGFFRFLAGRYSGSWARTGR